MELSIRTQSRIEIGSKAPHLEKSSGESIVVSGDTGKVLLVSGVNEYGWYGIGGPGSVPGDCAGCVFDEIPVTRLSAKYGSFPCADCTARIGTNIYVKAK